MVDSISRRGNLVVRDSFEGGTSISTHPTKDRQADSRLQVATPMFLGSADIQLGVNESLYDTSRVVSSMVDGIMARVGEHSDIEVRLPARPVRSEADPD